MPQEDPDFAPDTGAAAVQPPRKHRKKGGTSARGHGFGKPRCTINREDALAIYRLKGSEVHSSVVGAMFGIQPKTVRDVWGHRTWRHATSAVWGGEGREEAKKKKKGKAKNGPETVDAECQTEWSLVGAWGGEERWEGGCCADDFVHAEEEEVDLLCYEESL